MPAANLDWDAAVIPERKLTSYLLALDHPEGGPKAAFFISCGFDASDPLLLAAALRAQARNAAVTFVQGPYGVKLVADGSLVGTDGRVRRVLSIWIVEQNDSAPRFVTAYPKEALDGDR